MVIGKNNENKILINILGLGNLMNFISLESKRPIQFFYL
jgi:hypothetical protein